METEMTQPPLCYPHPAGHHLSRPPNSDIHQTAGLAGNWALDFMAPGGTPVLCPQDMTIVSLTGHDPALGEVAPGIFGWNIYGRTSGGVYYFSTHYSERFVKVGQVVKRGEHMATVGEWPHDPPRSHTHMGVTHPYGKLPAVA